MSSPVRVGVLGCAEIARRRMLPTFLAAPQVDLVTVASRDPARAARVADQFGCAAAPDYTAVLADDKITAVYIPLPAALHAQWTEAALRAGKHVLAEKPVTTNAVTTAYLVDLARSRRLVLMENVMFIHHGQHATVRQLVADGAIGELRAFEACFTVPRRPEGDIRHRPDLGGGALWDTGVYPVRAALHIVGPDLHVVGATAGRSAADAVDTAGAALLRGPHGVGVQLSWGLDHAYRNTYSVTGSLGRLIVTSAFTVPADRPAVLSLERAGAVEAVPLPAEDQVANTVTAFVTAIREGHPPQADCVRQARLLEAIRRDQKLRSGR